jgi:hypothetical protein
MILIKSGTPKNNMAILKYFPCGNKDNMKI